MNTQTNRLILVSALLVILSFFAGYSMLALQSSNSLLQKLSTIEPGVKLDAIKNQLGLQMYAFSDADGILRMGRVKNPDFCRDKKLFIFSGSDWPARALEVYTDQNEVIVYVTWQQL